MLVSSQRPDRGRLESLSGGLDDGKLAIDLDAEAGS